MVKRIYSAKKGAQFSNEQAQVYGPHLERLQKNKGDKLTPSDVVKDAKKKSSPTHNFFEWDNKDAGNKWRKYQARHLLNSIEVIIKEYPSEPVKLFYNVVNGDDSEDQQGYVTIEKVMSQEEYRKQIIEHALRELRGWEKRYRIYNELSHLFSVMNREIIKVEKTCKIEA